MTATVIDKGRTGWTIVDWSEHMRRRSVTIQAIDGWITMALGVDDVGERETTPPYDKPLRGMQVIIRTYEHDSRAIRQVRVNQHFMPE